jgi:cadmium resistance protein CadD (predicted permease)
MHETIKTLITAITAFTATNLDDILLLTLFFGQAGPRGFHRWHILVNNRTLHHFFGF